MRTFRSHIQIAITDLDFLLLLAQNCKKKTIFDNLRTIAQESHMQTGQVTPFFSYTFLLQTVCEIIFCILK